MPEYITVSTPEHIAKSTNGTGPYIKMRKRIKQKYITALSEIMVLSRKVAAIDEINPSAEDAEVVAEFNRRYDFMWDSFGHIVVEWNWLDEDTNEPLPQPKDNPNVFKEDLYNDQMAYIRDQINEVLKLRATEGNVKSTGG